MKPKCLAPIAALLLLAGCTAAQIAATAPITSTLAQTAAAQNTTAAAAVDAGELFCAGAGSVAAITTPTGGIVSVINKDAATVASYCPLLNGVPSKPVSPPAAPGATPVATKAVTS